MNFVGHIVDVVGFCNVDLAVDPDAVGNNRSCSVVYLDYLSGIDLLYCPIYIVDYLFAVVYPFGRFLDC